ncbi:Transcriptional regulator with XRE-family HTH domain [Gammaproteobacteria bacterium]
MTINRFSSWWSMSLPSRLIALRKKKGLSQQAMAEAIGIHANSWKNYETGQTLPSLDILKKIAVELHVSTDFLIFEEHERGPKDDLMLQFEAVSQLQPEEQAIIKDVLESLVIKYQNRRWEAARAAMAASEKMGATAIGNPALTRG